jgi:AraC-like DNA-binding protein
MDSLGRIMELISKRDDACVAVLSDPAEDPRSVDRVRFWPMRDGVMAASARFVRHRFRPHTHDVLMLGLIEAGTKGFARERASYVAGPGSISLVNPGEMHTGERLSGQELRYRALYVPSAALGMAGGNAGGDGYDIAFPSGTIQDPPLYTALQEAHSAIARGDERLLQDSLLLEAMNGLIHRHGTPHDRRSSQPAIPAAARQVREILRARFAEDLPISELAQAVGISAFHLMRAFRHAVGLPIHAYQIQLRVEASKRLLASGLAPAHVAVEVGFADQSHLTRRFKSLVGTSPGDYQRTILRSC